MKFLILLARSRKNQTSCCKQATEGLRVEGETLPSGVLLAVNLEIDVTRPNPSAAWDSGGAPSPRLAGRGRHHLPSGSREQGLSLDAPSAQEPLPGSACPFRGVIPAAFFLMWFPTFCAKTVCLLFTVHLGSNDREEKRKKHFHPVYK